jgi:dGTPase
LEAAGWIDPNVVEAACLAHDLGHPPFGHIAENELQSCIKPYRLDSFEGNAQSFRIVTKLAVRSFGEKGLNLTRATLRAILKYPWMFEDASKLPKSRDKWGAYSTEGQQLQHALNGRSSSQPNTEARLMDWADDVTYAVHDVEDFYRAGLIPLDRLATSRDERRRFLKYLEPRFPKQMAACNALRSVTVAVTEVVGAVTWIASHAFAASPACRRA